MYSRDNFYCRNSDRPVNLDVPNLAVFVDSSLLHYAGERDNKVLTLLIETAEPPSANERPRLVLEAVRK